MIVKILQLSGNVSKISMLVTFVIPCLFFILSCNKTLKLRKYQGLKSMWIKRKSRVLLAACKLIESLCKTICHYLVKFNNLFSVTQCVGQAELTL